MAGFNITISGDSAINLEFAKTISPQTSGMIRVAAQTLTDDPIPGVTELVPTFCSLMVTYDPCVIGYDELCQRVQGKLRNLAAAEAGVKRIVVIPVCYGGEFGPDLADVASLAGLSAEEVIRRHSSRDYRIYMLGFLPGFPYLGGLDESISAPRLDSPRERIPRGSVGIGGSQTGIYPMESPGGWRLIGRTPILPYDPTRTPPVLYAAGDSIRFVPIDRARYDALAAAVAAGTYIHQVAEESI